MKRALVCLLVAAGVGSCGPKPAPAPVPLLPGDGDAHVSKPVDAQAPTVANDLWTGKPDLITAPPAKVPAKVELPKIEELTLSNGLQVFVVKSDKLPVVSLQLAIKAGRRHEPRARLGVSEAAADMLVKGTKKRDAIALAKAIDFVGGTIAADETYEATLVSCSVLARNLPTCLELMPEMVSQPSFPEDELAKEKDNLLAAVRQRLDDAGNLASAHVQNLLWGNEHVRGWINSEASVAALKRDDLIAWHRAWFAPNNSILVVSGDVDGKKLKGDLERAFGAWKKVAISPAPTYPEPGLSGIRIRLVDKPGQTQTHIRVAQFGIKHEDPRFFDTLVWNYTLGGGAFSSRLMKVVRVEGGKTYGASSTFDRNIDRGSLVAQTFTRNSEAVATTKLLTAEIAKMAKTGPTQDEVTAAIANIAGSYGLRFQSAADIGAALVTAELHGFGVEYLTNYSLAVGKVDVDAARRAAAEILDPKNYAIVMVGDAKDIEPQLKKEGWRYEKVAFTDPITVGPKQVEVVVDPKAAQAAKQLLDEALVAKGGKAKLAAIKGMRMTATGTTTINGQQYPVEIERVFLLPDKMRIDATIAKQVKVIVGVDGRVGWQLAPTQTGPVQLSEITGKDMLAIDFERWREPELILLKATDPAAKLVPAPDDTIDGKPQSVVKLASPFPGLEVALYIDKKTKLVTRMTYSDNGANELDEFNDYRDDAGVKVAHKRKSTTAGRVTELQIDKFEVDPKIDAETFKKPPPSPTK